MDLENEIHFMSRPLVQAFNSFSDRKTGEMARFSKKMSEKHIRDEMSIEDAWRSSLDEMRSRWVLHQEEWSLMASIGEVVGKTDRTSQSAYIRMMREKFCIQEKKAEEDRTRKEKLYKSLGALGGLALVLVLI